MLWACVVEEDGATPWCRIAEASFPVPACGSSADAELRACSEAFAGVAEFLKHGTILFNPDGTVIRSYDP